MFDVELQGAAAIQETLRSGFWRGPVRQRLVKGAAIAAQTTARRAAKPHAADKGTLGRFVLLHIDADGLLARVDMAPSVAGVAFTIEEGRRPGRRPPYKAIKRWMISHGIIGEGRGRGTSAAVQLMRERIRASGTEGVHFMAQARDVAEMVLQRGVPGTEDDIRALWERAT
jgi:hypothetical protein